MLDLAAGAGRHVRLLLDHGFSVCAVDRDIAGLLSLAGPRCTVRQIDLETGKPWPLGDGYDGIIVTNYLHRPLLTAIGRALAPGGALIYETFALGNERLGRPRNPEFLLYPGELLEAFAMLTVVAFEQGGISVPRLAVIQRLAATTGPLGQLPEATSLDSSARRGNLYVMPNTAKKLMSREELLAGHRDLPAGTNILAAPNNNDGRLRRSRHGLLEPDLIGASMRRATALWVKQKVY